MSTDEPAADASRFRWLDRWLGPRWRALLTWVVIATGTAAAVAPHISSAYISFVLSVQERLIALSPVPVPALVRSISLGATYRLLGLWFPPIILRLGVWRMIAWVVIGLVAHLVVDSWIAQPSNTSWGHKILLETIVLGLPGLAVLGRRSRPWAGFVAGCLSAGWWVLLPLSAWEFLQDWWNPLPWLTETVVSAFLYATVMLYCTQPLTRQPAEGQAAEDLR